MKSRIEEIMERAGIERKKSDKKLTNAETLKFFIDSPSVYTPLILSFDPIKNSNILSGYEFAYIDAKSIKLGELVGTDYATRDFYAPIWYQDMLKTKLVVIDNLTQIPHTWDDKDNSDLSDYGDKAVTQSDFLFLCRRADEGKPYTLLNFGSQYFVPDDTMVIILIKENVKYQLAEPIRSRVSQFEWKDEKEIGN
ncbi:MAG: hypothetical protein LBT20_03930 [Clostridiales bacterium]|jgi:hypothetical protein|nr:hypothetical protein [Clostridiales bacterium]